MTNKERVADASKTTDHIADGGKKVELMPCPFCGAMPRIVSFKHTFSRFLVYQVMCFSCNTKPKYLARGRTEQEAIEAWNRRSDGK